MKVRCFPSCVSPKQEYSARLFHDCSSLILRFGASWFCHAYGNFLLRKVSARVRVAAMGIEDSLEMEISMWDEKQLTEGKRLERESTCLLVNNHFRLRIKF